MLPVLPHSFPTRRSSDLLATPSRGSQQSGDIAVASEASSTGAYRGAQGLRPEFIAELERQFGLDKPAHERFFLMIRNYLAFDFGESFRSDEHTSELQSLMRISYAVFCLKKKKQQPTNQK